MIRFVLALLAATICLATSIDAAVISRDWKTPGDGLLTYDDVNQRVWLDLTESRLAQFPGSKFEAKYQALLPELAANGMFEGFTVAMSGDLSALAISAGIDVAAVDNFSHNAAPTTFLMQLVGISFNSNNVQSYGLLDEIGMVGSVVFRNLGMLSVSSFSGPNGQAGLHFGMPGDLALPSNTGVWLFRAIPEATGQSLAIVALAAFVLSRPGRKGDMLLK